ncbi:MAG: acetylxylan esterase [Aureliella sp.]
MKLTCLSTAVLALVCTAVFAQDQATTGASPWKANPETVKKLSARRGDFNYVESKVPDYVLPDPLKTSGVEQVTEPEQWPARREELMELFREHVYGHRPETQAEISFEVTEEREALDGDAIARTVKVIVKIDDRTYDYLVSVFIPKLRKGPAPVLIHINNRYFLSIDDAEKNDPFWPVKTIVSRGYATASFHTSDVDPDKKNAYAEGIRSFFADGADPEPNAWRSLSAWGWAASRVLDYMETCPEVDATRASVSGHSRGGKTSLWAAAEDTRFAIGYSNNSGCGGAALSRRRFGETVGRITEVFPYWFTPNFAKFSGNEDSLPVDQHELIALIAPRATYVTSSDEDLWADPKGEYTSLAMAAPVYQLLGKKCITNTEMPPINSPRHVGSTGYHIRTGGHGLGEQDWAWFMNFADQHLKAK